MIRLPTTVLAQNNAGVGVKNQQIAGGGDPSESGSGRLDFGHWTAYTFERLSRHRLRHGEAVALGVAHLG
ncbi:3-dehydroquinate synthase family protein [Actinomadura opuntiae]|uniref:3-dehydroquinate synthase family protein n=1 Tax=Actinomadura sp. OS1-43 TaxID=604315 RepID=UPI00255AA8CD|nr:hypothetical protein [Actinomadura sp. OS1-43]MDL4818524.1 hypothetical protein [Actinomadura sp. OS1-43]